MTTETTFTGVDRLRLRFAITQIILLLSLSGLLAEEVTRTTLLIALSSFVFLTLLFPQLAGILPQKWTRLSGICLIIYASIDFYLNWRQPLDPVMRVGLLVVWTRTIQYRSIRESQQVLIIALFLIMLTGVISISISYAFQLLILTPLAMTLLILNTTHNPQKRSILQHSDWVAFNHFEFIRRLLITCNWRLMGVVSLLFVFLLATSSIIFLAIPRFHFAHMFRLFSVPGISKSGFSEEFSLGAVNDIILDNTIAFRVDVPSRESIPEIPYWRMLVLDHYENGKFSLSESYFSGYKPPSLFKNIHYIPPISIPPNGRQNLEDWTFYLEGSVSRYLPILGYFRGIEFQTLESFVFDPVVSTFRIRNTPSKVFFFKTHRTNPDALFTNRTMDRVLREQESLWLHPDESTQIARLSYPQTTKTLVLDEQDAAFLDQVVDQIAQQVPDGSTSEFAAAAIRYLHANHEYSLRSRIPKGNTTSDDPIIRWLESKSDGHCEYFAAAFSLIMRKAGYATRLVTGFAGGSWNDYEKYFVVRNRNAHAWCEVFDEVEGWQQFEPTPASRLDYRFEENDAFAFLENSKFANWMDSLKIQYYRRVISFDGKDQFSFFENSSEKLWKLQQFFNRQKSLFSKLFQSPSNNEQADNHASKWRVLWWLIPIAGSVVAIVVFRKREKLSAEDKIRQKAGRFLQSANGMDEVNVDVLRQLERIRYGPIETWQAPKQIFKDFKKLRNSQNTHKKAF